MIRIRRNFDNTHLANIYDISEGYVSRILACWIPLLAIKMRSSIMWVCRDQQQPVACFSLFPRCVAVMDCFELFIEKPGSKIEQQHYWSEYKHHHTVKFLVCVSPNGMIMYISPTYSGRTSDSAIVQASSDGFLKELIRGDVLLADRGFRLREFFFVHYGVQLLVPKFLIVPQFSRDDVSYARKLSSARIHVERIIGELRCFNILRAVCPVHLLDLMDDIVVICAATVNMNPPIVS